jgi:WD40 repeat protein
LISEVVAVLSKNGNKLKVVSTPYDKTVRIWDLEKGEQENSFEGHGSRTVGLAVSMDGRRIVSGAKNGKIIIWDADTKEIIRLICHTREFCKRPSAMTTHYAFLY